MLSNVGTFNWTVIDIAEILSLRVVLQKILNTKEHRVWLSRWVINRKQNNYSLGHLFCNLHNYWIDCSSIFHELFSSIFADHWCTTKSGDTVGLKDWVSCTCPTDPGSQIWQVKDEMAPCDFTISSIKVCYYGWSGCSSVRKCCNQPTFKP